MVYSEIAKFVTVSFHLQLDVTKIMVIGLISIILFEIWFMCFCCDHLMEK